MTSIVKELRRDALDSKISVSDLLNKALVVAVKLNLPESEKWIRWELAGYLDVDASEIPRYREIRGIPRWQNELGGWIPIVLNAKLQSKISQMPVRNPITEIEQWAKQKEGHLIFSADMVKVLQHYVPNLCNATLCFSGSVVSSTLQAVRTRVLDWALELEKQGIVGEGLSFSDKEKAVAARLSRNTYNISAGGSVQIQSDSPHASQSSSVNTLDIDALRKLMLEIKSMVDSPELDKAQKDEIKAEVATVLSQTDSPHPKKGIIVETVKSIQRILESANASIFADLIKQCGKWLATL